MRFLLWCVFCVSSVWGESLWILGTSSLPVHNPVREQQYREGMKSIAEHVLNRPDVRKAFPDGYRHVVYVENNGHRSTPLNEFIEEAAQQSRGVDWRVVYTNTNLLNISNSGVKEALDEFDVTTHLTQLEDDWIVKLTGRYRVTADSPLITALVQSKDSIDVIYRPGAYYQRDWPLEQYDKLDCISGFFAMRQRRWEQYREWFYSRNDLWKETEPAEWWLARFIQSQVPQERILLVPKLGAWIAPGSDTFFEV